METTKKNPAKSDVLRQTIVNMEIEAVRKNRWLTHEEKKSKILELSNLFVKNEL